MDMGSLSIGGLGLGYTELGDGFGGGGQVFGVGVQPALGGLDRDDGGTVARIETAGEGDEAVVGDAFALEVAPEIVCDILAAFGKTAWPLADKEMGTMGWRVLPGWVGEAGLSPGDGAHLGLDGIVQSAGSELAYKLGANVHLGIGVTAQPMACHALQPRPARPDTGLVVADEVQGSAGVSGVVVGERVH